LYFVSSVNVSASLLYPFQDELMQESVYFYILGSVHCESNLLTVQQDATYSVYYISVGSSTCSRCWHPSSGARTTVITASGIY